MKGVILGGGLGTRLRPSTNNRNKHTLLVANRAMIEYPILRLCCEGITDICICLNGPYGRQVEDVVGDGHHLGCHVSYFYESGDVMGPGRSLLEAKEWGSSNENIAVLFGDGIFFSPLKLAEKNSPNIFLMHLSAKGPDDPSKYAQARIGNGLVLDLVEKPNTLVSTLVQTGAFIFSADVFDVIEDLAQTRLRDQEIGITDINLHYVSKSCLSYSLLPYGAYIDCGTFKALYEAERRLIESRLLGISIY